MAGLDEVVEEAAPDLMGLHWKASLVCCGGFGRCSRVPPGRRHPEIRCRGGNGGSVMPMFSAAMKASGGNMPMLCAAVPQKATDVPRLMAVPMR